MFPYGSGGRNFRGTPRLNARGAAIGNDVRIRENGDDLNALQARILKIVEQEPGMAVSNLADNLGLSRHVALYHVRKLAQADLARLERRMARLRAYPNGEAHRS